MRERACYRRWRVLTGRSHAIRALLFGFAAVAITVATTADRNSASASSSRSSKDGDPDAISTGFFNPPPGVKPVNRIALSHIPNARPSYSWRIHRGKRELVEFPTAIQHVIVIYMENRTPEDLFGAFYSVTNPSTGNTFGTDLKLTNPTLVSPSLSPEPLNYRENPDHEHWNFVGEATGVWPVNAHSGYWYVPTPPPFIPASPSVSNYITLIEQYAYNNSMLQSNEGPSFEAHQYLIAGQSGGLPSSNIHPNGMTDNPSLPGPNKPPGNGTCFTAFTPPGQQVSLVNMYSPYPTPSPTPSPTAAPPCNEYPTILDAMASAAPMSSPYVQWQYIAKDDTSIWSAPMAVTHLYNEYVTDPNPEKTGQPFAVDPDAENWVLNFTSSTSPAPSPARPISLLTVITPCLGESDHPNAKAPTPGAATPSAYDDGPDWLAYIINAIEGSPYFPNTAVIVTWDDWGGFYDNFSPSPWPYHPPGNQYSPSPTQPGNPQDPNEWGFRVPMMMISPYVKSVGYISSTMQSQGAILNFIETIFGLPTHVLGADDAANGTNDLTDMLNFSATIPPQTMLPTNFTPQYDDQCPTPSPRPS
jgi:Phosphoesterase family